ncbi:ATP-binding protein [Trichococcus shcherbakoviae]|uniref:ATP-binding protein n=1 Tax=Trichococcus shcherbakoviae TaxID=2094020 RepID=UPI0015DA2D2E|nr:ATP-binding protein [Trichococcus shcherbakoviae]
MIRLTNFVSNAIKFTDPGLGLGMALVLRVVNLLKVVITVESTLGKGTKMTVELPRG